MPFVNIDAPGGARDRIAVTQIQKRHNGPALLAAANAKRNRRNAKRAHGPGVIILNKMPVGDPPGLCQDDPEGAYVWGGTAEVGRRYQVVVAGPLVAPVADYTAALSKWLARPMLLVEEKPLDRPEPDRHPDRPYLSLIFEPATIKHRYQAVV